MRFRPAAGIPITRLNVEGFTFNIPSDFNELSAELLTVKGWHGLVKSFSSSRCFYVLEGRGTFIVAGNEMNVEPGDVVMVPRGEPHDYTGEMKLFVVHSPAREKRHEQELE